MDISKLKVVELRAELAKRGLDQKGVKAVLVARLHEALEAEKGDAEDDEEEEEQEDEKVPLSQVQEETAPPSAEPGGHDEVSAQSMQSSEPDVTQPEEDSLQFSAFQEESESKLGYEVNEDSVAHPPYSETSSDVPAVADEVSAQSFEYTDSKRGFEMSGDSLEPPSVTVTSVSKQDEESKDNFQNYEDSSECLQEDSSTKMNFEEQSLDTWNQIEMNQHGDDSVQAFQMQDSSLQLDDSNAQDALESTQGLSFTEEEKSDKKTDFESEIKTNSESKMDIDVKVEDADGGTKAKPEVDGKSIETETEMEVVHDQEQASKEKDLSKERKNRWDDSKPSEVTESRKRQRSSSPDKNKTSSAPRRTDDEPEFDENAVLLSWYDSDLHMLINKENFSSATLITSNGFGYVWAGVRATYGFDKGKVYYEVRISEHIKVGYLENETHPNILRVGWSVQGSSLQLGEEPLSYGFEGSGKISTNCQFQNYGKAFAVSDVVGVYLNMEGDQIEISYTINGEYQGVAYSINREELNGQALFPHILSKNCSFDVNFGNREPWTQILEGYTNVGEIPLEDRIPGPKRPQKREDCEVIMLIGLPGCGKTTWAKNYAAEHKDKMYNILGTSALIDKMTVMGAPRRKNYQGRWEVLIAKCTKCLNTLLDIGAYRRRNYIIDQTNVYPSAQRRKMRSFEGFVRRAVVMVPTDEELKARTAKREAEEGKDIADTSVLEMKANFGAPEKGDAFDEVIYTDLQEEEAKKVIAQYNKEGNDHGFFSNAQQQKRFRTDDRVNDRRDFRGDGDRRMDNRGRPDHRGGHDGWRDRGGFNHRRGDNRGWGPPRPGPGGWRNNRGGGGWRGGPPNRFIDRGGHGPRDMRDRNRDFRDRRDGPPGGSGGGGKMADRRSGDRDDKNRPKSMAPVNQPQGWGNQSHGYNQGWGQNYNQGWGNWNQGYNQQSWKNFAQQSPQQSWGQSGWGQQGWGGQGWNQQYYNQYQQNWPQQQQQQQHQHQQPQAQGMSSGSETSTTNTGSGSDTSAMAATAYASYGQAGSWAGYTTMGSTGYATVGSAGGGNAASGTGSTSSYSSQKQYRPDPRKT